MPIPLTDAEKRATDRLLQQYKDATAPGVFEIVAESANEFQDLCDALATFDTELVFPSVTGVNLDLLGKIVGEPRDGRPDDIYQLWIQGRIRANRSNGSIDDLILVAQALTNGLATIRIRETFPAEITVKVNGALVDNPQEFANIIKIARKAGVRSNLEYSTALTGQGFSFAGGVGKGFPDSSLTPGSGGKLAGVILG